MKIKYNADKDNYTLKGVSPTEISLIIGLLSHVRLGSDNEYSEAAFDMANDFEVSGLGSDASVSISLEEDGFIIEVE